MKEPLRISAKEVRERLKSGKSLLVCAYDDQEKFKQVRLERAISLPEFRSQLPSLTRSHEIIFYCA